MDKKELLKQLEEHFGEKPKYMGAPSFAYQVKAGDDVYIIDREGRIKNTEGEEVEFGKLLSFESKTDASEASPASTTEVNIPEAETPVDRLEVILLMGEHNCFTLRNLVNMIASKQSLIQQSLDLKHAIIDQDFAKAINEKVIAIIEDFESIVLEIGPEKCPGIGFDFDNKTITFKFFEGELEPDRLKAYTDLVTLINKNAQTLKHASMKPTITDNPKFSFRTWLLRLGMIGGEYKSTRKVLLANLSGNSAFRDQPSRKNDSTSQVKGGRA
ncbi:virulence-related protein [Desulfosporosinus sp.]|uniref:virulence-related protein n=1 Tax=Desulfosporosinus sp. TaxID=157907 RepID=UPI0025BFEBBA|nr:virulence-related protein [Desulfosporosinus sp.]MBC2722019.1 virulence-related protein [Desulfosporosinus sp.]MBC2728002.1 virulence-related protein [Desulfosporosinus sp.]